MKLQRHRNRKIGDIEYSKWVIVVPPDTVRDLKWDPDQELEGKTNGRALVLRPARKSRAAPPAAV